jgi:hypothetical protein
MKKNTMFIIFALIIVIAVAVLIYVSQRSCQREIKLDAKSINQIMYLKNPHITTNITLTDTQRISEIVEEFNRLGLMPADTLSDHLVAPTYRLEFLQDNGSMIQIELYEEAICIKDDENFLLATEYKDFYTIINTTCIDLLNGEIE